MFYDIWLLRLSGGGVHNATGGHEPVHLFFVPLDPQGNALPDETPRLRLPFIRPPRMLLIQHWHPRFGEHFSLMCCS
jgi:hypothetical protein